jgi:hypothetical protein
MRQDFQRADFGLLIGDDELLDGNELSIGFVRIAADGLQSTYKATYGEKPALDMNFNPGKAVLPFPFTLEEFKAFCAWHPLFTPEIIEKRFTNKDDSIDNEALAELDDRSRLAGTLVRSILGIPVEAEAEAEVALDEPVKTGPPTATPAPVGVEIPAAATPAPLVAEGAYLAQPKQRAQETRILELLTTNGYTPLKLELRKPGKPGPKAEIRTLALNEAALFSKNSFDKAWERLRSDGTVAGAD